MKHFSLKTLGLALMPLTLVAAGIPFPYEQEILDSIAKHGIDESYAEKPAAHVALWKPSKTEVQPSKKDKKHKHDKICCDKPGAQGYYSERLAILDAAVDNFVTSGLAPSAFTSSSAGCEKHKHYAGVENIASQKPFTGDTIIRLFSQGKFLGTVGLLKLIDKGIITGFERLADFIPEFANTKVLQAYTPAVCPAVLSNPLSTVAGSATVTFADATIRQVGDWIGIENASNANGIPASEINGVHQVTAVTAGSFSFAVTTPALATGSQLGGCIIVQSLDCGVQSTITAGKTYYYTTAPLNRAITLYHVMTHGLGYCYTGLGGFGFAEDRYLQNTQIGILNQTAGGIPAGNPNPSLPLSSKGIREWAAALAQVPLLFQPGTNWSYGPTLSILGAVIEVIDARLGNNRDLETYMQEEILKPLGMNSTGFFIQNNDPTRSEKLTRIQTLYFVAAPHVFIPFSVIPGSEFNEDYFYGAAQPKTLALIDGGMYGTPNDYLKFMKMFLNKGFASSGESILSPAMITWLSENHTLENTVYNLFPVTGKGVKWGLGTGVATGALNAGLESTSRRSILWGGAAGTKWCIDLGNNAVSTVGTNLFSTPNIQDNTENALQNLNWSALTCSNPNNENSSGNNPTSATNPS